MTFAVIKDYTIYKWYVVCKVQICEMCNFETQQCVLLHQHHWIKYGNFSEIHFHRKLCLCLCARVKIFPVEKWNGLQTPAYFSTLVGWLFMWWFPTSMLYFTLFSFYFRTLIFSFGCFGKNVGGVKVKSLQRAFSWNFQMKSIAFTYPKIHLSLHNVYVASSFHLISFTH